MVFMWNTRSECPFFYASFLIVWSEQKTDPHLGELARYVARTQPAGDRLQQPQHVARAGGQRERAQVLDQLRQLLELLTAADIVLVVL